MIIKHDKIDSVSVSRNENHHDFITGKRGFMCMNVYTTLSVPLN